jgi:hypothetical protein
MMTSIVSKMIAVLNGVGGDVFDVSSHLHKQDDGMRLAGYAYLYANPDTRQTQELVAALVNEANHFAQYWALRALHRQVVLEPSTLDFSTRNALETLLASLGPNTDRGYELRQVLDTAQPKG